MSFDDTPTASASVPDAMTSDNTTLDGTSTYYSSQNQTQMELPNDPDARCTAEAGPNIDVDPQILEALKSGKDRLYVLKLGEQMEELIQECHARSKVDLMPETTYQRLLVHRCAAYYKLAPENEPISRGISVLVTLESRIPPRRLSDLVPAEEIAHPTFKIMRRSVQDRRRSRPSYSQPGSIAGEDGDMSDPDPSETGSAGGRSSASKKRMTIAEREAAYQEARSRIFMDFEEKEKAKERDTSANSSTLSLVSGSGSASGGGGSSSVDDIDDTGSTIPTESERSVPVSRDNKDNRRGGGSGGSSSGPSIRSVRASTSSFNGRGSGAASPAFSYPSLYEPVPSSNLGDNSGNVPQHPGGYLPPYPMYPYPPQGQVPGQPYLGPYPYYPQYPYPLPQQPPHPNSDPTSPASAPADLYPQQQHPQNPYVNPYMWSHGPFPPQGHPQTQPQGEHPQLSQSQHGQHANTPTHALPPANSYPPQPFPPYMAGPAPYGAYAMPPYYHPQLPPPPVHSHPQPPYPVEQQPHANGHGNNLVNGNNAHGQPPRNANGQAAGNKRNAPAARTAWSYGPGITMGGVGYGGVSVSGSQYMQSGGDTVGPRLSTNVRRTSGASVGSSSGGNRTPGDETGSTTSSSTSSSSSRRTFLSTSSKHPLPARPDWAAGLKPHPTLHPSPNRHRDSNSSSRNMSPAHASVHLPQNQGPQQPTQQLPPILLQATDFPPLSMSSTAAEKRPVVGGVWTNPTTARTVLAPNPGQAEHLPGQSYGNALVHHAIPNGGGPATRLDDHDRGFERPPAKSAELFNPKSPVNGAKRPSPAPGSPFDKAEKERLETERVRGEAIASAILVDKAAALKLHDQFVGQSADKGKGDTNGMASTASKDSSVGDSASGVPP